MATKVDEVRIELNKFKIIHRVWNKNIFPKWLFILWGVLSVIILILRISDQNIDFINIKWLSFSSIIFPGVTGLSFSVTMLNATRNLFNTDDLVKMYQYVDPEDADNSEEGNLLYRTLAPYITAAFLWLIISLIALIGSLFEIDISKLPHNTLVNFIKELLYSLYYSMIVAGLLNLWYLISIHLDDISMKVENKLNK
ncbi:MAG: hypothetical protein KH426_07140 [Streptococcus salivarius]|nr:hypothetical protein [Streptococcus salivarius]